MVTNYFTTPSFSTPGLTIFSCTDTKEFLPQIMHQILKRISFHFITLLRAFLQTLRDFVVNEEGKPTLNSRSKKWASGCSSVESTRLVTERLWVRILLGTGLFLFSISSVGHPYSGPSLRCNHINFLLKMAA